MEGGTITVIEGNISNAVGYRKIQVNGKYIRGYGVPDYASMADPVQLFDDVAPEKWYAQSIAYCVQHGIMQGDGNGKFRPEEPITRAEMAAVAERLHKMLA